MAWVLHPENPALRLVRAEPPAGGDAADVADPFVSIGDRGGLSRVLLAEQVGPTGASIRRVALKVQSDDYPFLAEGAPAALTADAVERAWDAEVGLLERCVEWAGLPQVVEVLARAPGEAARLPPLLYCRRRDAYFRAVCPACAGTLTDVRDDRWLEERGLPRRDRSMTRFVGCASCLARGNARLWTLLKDPRLGRDVGDHADLVRGLGAIARRSGDAIPCQGCSHVPACHPEPGAGTPEVLRVVTPVTFFEARAIALEPAALRWDEAVALAGGAQMDEVLGAAEPARRALLEPLARRIAREPARLFAHDAGGKLGLEVLRIKLGLVAGLCRAVAGLHRHGGSPHLGIAPARALVDVEGRGSGLPWLWRLAAVLTGAGNVMPRALAGGSPADLPVPSYARPRAIDPGYAAPVLREAPASDLPAVVMVRRVEALADGRTSVVLDVESDRLDPAAVGDKDTVDVAVVHGRPPVTLQVTGVSAGAAGRALRLRALPMPLDGSVRAALQQVVDQPLARARATLHPCLHVPLDVHALGMVLLGTLLGGAPLAVAQVVEAAQARLMPALARAADDDETAIATAALAAFDDPAFDRTRLFAVPARWRDAAAAVPEALWREALLVGLRAVTAVRGFSVCRGRSDFDPAHPEVKAEYLLQLVDALVRRVDAALFGLPGRGADLRRAIGRVARELKVE